jgi:coenzyme PQQ precursor peptide PqqA
LIPSWQRRAAEEQFGGEIENPTGELLMKIWTKPAVRETEVGLEVTSYLPAEIDLI